MRSKEWLRILNSTNPIHIPVLRTLGWVTVMLLISMLGRYDGYISTEKPGADVMTAPEKNQYKYRDILVFSV